MHRRRDDRRCSQVHWNHWKQAGQIWDGIQPDSAQAVARWMYAPAGLEKAAWLIFFDVEGVQKMRTVIVDSVALGAGWYSMPSPLDPEKRWAGGRRSSRGAGRARRALTLRRGPQ
jgi:hypothetical protein